MSGLEKPKAVWISPAMIGQKPKERKVFGVKEPSHTSESAPTSLEDSSIGATEKLQGEETGDTVTSPSSAETKEDVPKEEVVIMEETTVKEPESLESPVDPAMIPLPDSDSDEEADLLESRTSVIRKVMEVDIPDLATYSNEVSPLWSSPTWSDEGISARVWVSPYIAEYERWMIVKANLKTMELIPRSPFVPRTFAEWLTHRAEMIDIKVKELSRKVAIRESLAALKPKRPHVVTAFRGNTFEEADNGISRSGVGAEETFWSLWMKPTKYRPRASWPCQAEMKEEGDERNTSGFGRFPALPRVHGNETVNYKHKSIMPASRLDMVWPPPNPQEEICELDDDNARILVGKELAKALDAD